jgi:hypothetical protein
MSMCLVKDQQGFLDLEQIVITLEEKFISAL